MQILQKMKYNNYELSCFTKFTYLVTLIRLVQLIYIAMDVTVLN